MTKRTITVPKDLASALQAKNVRKKFDTLSYSHQREYMQWTDETKMPETVPAA